MNNYRVHIFYVITITSLVSSGNLLSVAHFLHYSIARAEGAASFARYSPRYQSIEAIVYNQQPWVHYVGNSLSIVTSLLLLFVATPRLDLNIRNRLLLVPYALCSIMMIVVPEYIVFKVVLASGNVYNDDALYAENNMSIPYLNTWNETTATNTSANEQRISTSVARNTSVLATTRIPETSTTGNRSCQENKDNNNKAVINHSSQMPTNNNATVQYTLLAHSRRERVSCFVIYQIWVALRVVFCLLVCRYLYFLQWSAITRRSPPKRSNATRRGVIDIRITEASPLV